jgi:hypothetical protein
MGIEEEFKRYRVLVLYLQGKTVSEILRDRELRKFGVDSEYVRGVIGDSKERLGKDSELLSEFTKLRELMKLEVLEREAWDVFERSKEDGILQEIERESSKGYERLVKRTKVENMKALEVILDCIKERNRVLGNISPIKAEHSGAIELRDLKINYIVPVEDEDRLQAE